MSSSYPAAAELMSEAHEERIQRLEGSVQTLVASSVQNTTELKHLSAKIDSNQTQVLEKLEEIAVGVQAQLRDGATRFEEHEQQLQAHNDVIESLKSEKREREKSRVKRSALAKKALFGAIAGIGGVFTHKIGAIIMAWFMGH